MLTRRRELPARCEHDQRFDTRQAPIVIDEPLLRFANIDEGQPKDSRGRKRIYSAPRAITNGESEFFVRQSTLTDERPCMALTLHPLA